MDMPSSCSKCKFMYEFYGVKKCQLLNILENGGKAIIPTNTLTAERKESCPLKPVPEKKVDGDSLKIAIENDCYDGTTEDKAYLNGVDRGYNACIDELLKGEEG